MSEQAEAGKPKTLQERVEDAHGRLSYQRRAIQELTKRVSLLEHSTFHALDPKKANFVVIHLPESSPSWDHTDIEKLAQGLKDRGIHSVIALPHDLDIEFLEHDPAQVPVKNPDVE